MWTPADVLLTINQLSSCLLVDIAMLLLEYDAFVYEAKSADCCQANA